MGFANDSSLYPRVLPFGIAPLSVLNVIVMAQRNITIFEGEGGGDQVLRGRPSWSIDVFVLYDGAPQPSNTPPIK